MAKARQRPTPVQPLAPSDESLILRWVSGEELSDIDLERLRHLLETSELARELLDAVLPNSRRPGEEEQFPESIGRKPARTRTSLRAFLNKQPTGTRYYFRGAQRILESKSPLEALLAYVFAMQERVQRRSIRLLRASDHGRGSEARKTIVKGVEEERLNRVAAETELAEFLGSRMPAGVPTEARNVRDHFMHGRNVSAAQIFSACCVVIEWCRLLDKAVRHSVGQGPMDDLRFKPRPANDDGVSDPKPPSVASTSRRRSRSESPEDPEDFRAQRHSNSVPANARKASRETGRIRSGSFWAAVRTAGLDRSAHDLSAVPDAEREVALAAALRVTMAPGGRSRSRRATTLNPRPTGSQLVVVHCKGTKFIIEEVREASLDDFVRFARIRLADYASSDYVLILVSKAIQSARGADQAPKLAAIIEECNLKHAMPCSPDRLLELLRRIADVSARRPQEDSPDSRADARARLRMFIHRNSPDTLGQAQIRRLNGYLDQMGWLDLGVDSEGPVPADVWDEIRLRLDDVRAGSNARSFLISQLQQLGSGLT